MHLLQLSMAHSMGKPLKGLSGAQLPMVRLHSNTVLPTATGQTTPGLRSEMSLTCSHFSVHSAEQPHLVHTQKCQRSSHSVLARVTSSHKSVHRHSA